MVEVLGSGGPQEGASDVTWKPMALRPLLELMLQARLAWEE
jgi:hypothetical protein